MVTKNTSYHKSSDGPIILKHYRRRKNGPREKRAKPVSEEEREKVVTNLDELASSGKDEKESGGRGTDMENH